MPWAADRAALVIGNNAYIHGGPLENPIRDAQAVAGALKQANFEVIEIQDAKVEDFYDGLERLKQKARNGRLALVFYAGHGVEVDGKNYLLPVDADLQNAAQLRTQAVELEAVLTDLKTTRCDASLVILDCCRDKPEFATRSWMRSRSISGGLAELPETGLPESTMVMFSAGPGQKALDGTGQNSPFTAALVSRLQQPGLSLLDAFFGTSDDVARVTGNKQEPWVKFNGAGRVFRQLVFLPSKGEMPRTTPLPPPTSPPLPRTASAKPITWSKGVLKAELQTFTLLSPTRAAAVIKLHNTSKEKTLKMGMDWMSPDPLLFPADPQNPPQGSDLHTAAGAHLVCLSVRGIQVVDYSTTIGNGGVFGGPKKTIGGATDLGPDDSITLTLEYGLVEMGGGFRVTTSRPGGHPPSSDRPVPVAARHRLSLHLWQAEVRGSEFSPSTRLTVEFENIPQTP
ncbi:MAG: caspase family protein [Prosthecobacter sp.]